MKRFFSYSLFLAFAALIVISCGGKKASNPEIKDFETYTDPSTKLEFKYPKGWAKGNESGRSFVAYSSVEARKEFLNMSNLGSEEEVPGAKVYVLTVKIEDGKTVQDMVDASRQFDASIYTAATDVTIDGTPAKKQTYTFPFKASNFEGEMYFATKDSQLVNIIMFEDIGGNFATLKPQFDQILKSVKLGVLAQKKTPITKVVTEELPGPSEKFIASAGQGFSIQMPDNFKMSNPTAKGSEKSFMYVGERRGDCSIQIDIMDTKGNKLAKILEDNAAKFGASSKTTVGGTEAGLFNYKASANLDSKIYFVIHNNKLYRIFVNYFKADAKIYKPAFDKMIKSISWK